MSVTVSKSQLKPRLLSFLRRLEKEKVPIVVTDRGRPMAEILPFRRRESDLFKELRGSVIRYDNPLEPVGEDDWDLRLRP